MIVVFSMVNVRPYNKTRIKTKQLKDKKSYNKYHREWYKLRVVNKK